MKGPDDEPPKNWQRADAKGAGAVAVNVAQSGTVTIYQNIVRLTDAQLRFITLENSAKTVTVEPGLSDICPYPGLEPFRTSEARFFAGREQQVSDLLEAVTNRPFAASIAASGAGKSSLVYAGLIPALGAREGEHWDIFALSPGQDPLHALARSMSGVLSEGGGLDGELDRIDRQAKSLRETPGRLADYVEEIIQCRSAAFKDSRYRVLFIIDQWEALYTQLNSSDDRRILLHELRDVAQRRLATFLLTMRADFMGDLLSDDRDFFEELEPGIRYLPKMNRHELRAAILEPASVVGLTVPEVLVARLTADIETQPGALPYLQFALERLWKKRNRQANCLETASYDKMEGIEGAIGKHASDIYEGLELKQRQLAEKIIPRLVNVSENGVLTSRRLAMAAFQEDGQQLLRKLAGPKSRLIVLSSSVGGTDDTSRFDKGETVAEIATEALLRDWKLLIEWVQNRPKFSRLRNLLEARAGEWETNSRHRHMLLRGKPLQHAKDLLAEAAPDETSASLKAYVNLSEKRQRAARFLLVGGTAAAIVVLFFATAYFATLSRELTASNAQRGQAVLDLEAQIVRAQRAQEAAEKASREARGRQLGAEARTVAQNATGPADFELAAALSIEAIRRHPSEAAYQAANLAMRQLPTQRVDLGDVNALEFLPNGSGYVLVRHDAAEIRNIGPSTLTVPLATTLRSISNAAFSASGEEVTLLNSSGEMEVFETSSGDMLREHDFDLVGTTGISADAAFIAVMDDDGLAQVFDTESGDEVSSIQTGVADYSPFAVLRSGQGILGVDALNILRIYFPDEHVGLPIFQLAVRPHLYSGTVDYLDLSGDERFVAVGLLDGTVHVIDIATQKEIFVFYGYRQGFAAIAPNNTILATSYNGFISSIVGQLNYLTGSLLDSFELRSDDLVSLHAPRRFLGFALHSFSGGVEVVDMNYERIASFDSPLFEIPDDSVVAFNGSNLAFSVGAVFSIVEIADQAFLVSDAGTDQTITALAFSANGDALMIGGREGQFQLVDQTSEVLFEAAVPGSVVAMASSLNAKRIVLADNDNNICRVFVSAGPGPVCFKHDEGGVSVAIADDGSRFLVEGVDGRVTLFDFDSAVEINSVAVPALSGDQFIPVSIAFFGSQARLAFGRFNDSVQLIDVETERTITFIQEGNAVTDVAFSGDGSRILVRSSDSTLGNFNLYDVSFQDLENYLCERRLGRNMTQEEWGLHMGVSESWRPTCQSWLQPEN